MLVINSTLFIQDNSGIKLGKCIRVPKIGYAKLGTVILISIVRKESRKKRLKLGQLCKALVVNTSNINFRRSGHWVKSLNSVIILKRSDDVPISKRIKGPVCSELRRTKMSRILSMGSYVFQKFFRF
jgi:large subunit ribosomal protein L14